MENTPKENKKRAVNLPDNGVGKQRYEIYRNATVWVELALKQGFNLEAITLVESMISDRLESRLTQLLGENYSHKELGKLIKKIREKETDQQLREIVSSDLDKWREDRNFAIHEMAKLTEGDTRTWQDRMEELSPMANTGLGLFKKINARVKSLKNFKHKNGF